MNSSSLRRLNRSADSILLLSRGRDIGSLPSFTVGPNRYAGMRVYLFQVRRNGNGDMIVSATLIVIMMKHIVMMMILVMTVIIIMVIISFNTINTISNVKARL